MPFQDENTLTYDEYPDWRGTQNLLTSKKEVLINILIYYYSLPMEYHTKKEKKRCIGKYLLGFF